MEPLNAVTDLVHMHIVALISAEVMRRGGEETTEDLLQNKPRRISFRLNSSRTIIR